jgi:hypothetical protein
MSLRWRGEPIRRTGLPSVSPAAWILVLRPPRERATKALGIRPLFPDGRRLPADAPALDHQPFQIGFARKCGKDRVQHPHLDLAIVWRRFTVS